MNHSFEDTLLEQLNEKNDILLLLECAINLISIEINHLMLSSFRKEKHATKFVIPALIGRDGPLNNLSVKLKLLYALGNISKEEYEDIELLLAMNNELDKTKHYQYTDDEILGPLSLLHDLILPPDFPLYNKNLSKSGIVNSMKSSIYHQRYQQIIRSALIIALTNLIINIHEHR